MSPRLTAAIETVYRAGRSTLGLFETPLNVELKADESPVTVADKKAEEIVRQELEKRFPGETILGEEQGLTGHSDDRWVVDPIDGTKSFVCGVPMYATLLGYEVAGEPVLGVCYIPPLDMMFYAEKGGGAFLNGRPISVSSRESLKGGVVCHASYHRFAGLGFASGYSKIVDKTLAARTWQDAYGHMLAACGRVEAMMDPTVSRWDISAVVPIVEEAGGRCSRFDGGSIWETIDGDGTLQLLSTNGQVHDEILADLRG